MDDDDLLSGDGTPADFLNSTGASSIYADNQTPADVIDNGAVTSTGNTTTVASPTWTNNLLSLFTAAGAGVSTVAPLLGKTTTTPKTAASTTATSTSTWLWVGAAAVVAVIAFILLRKH